MSDSTERAAVVAWLLQRPRQESADAEPVIQKAHYDDNGIWWPERKIPMKRLLGPHDYAAMIERGDHIRESL